MFLKSVQITNYKCINDSEEFTISSLTCLVGKNESGKSAILQSLYKFNPVEPDKQYDTVEEYPRNYLIDYEANPTDAASNILNTSWEIEDEECQNLEQILGPNSIADRIVTVKKGYNNTFTWDVSINQSQILKFYLSMVKLDEGFLESLSGVSSVGELFKVAL